MRITTLHWNGLHTFMHAKQAEKLKMSEKDDRVEFPLSVFRVKGVVLLLFGKMHVGNIISKVAS